jgi:two-component system chemotaxis response regulator CheY
MKHTVLIVEDEPDLRDLMSLTVEHAGFSVVTAGDGREALNAAKSIDHICVVLLDLLMPGMNGWDFLDAFKALPAYADTPVIVTTSAPSRAPANATLVMAKPIDPERLLAEVGKRCPPSSKTT